MKPITYALLASIGIAGAPILVKADEIAAAKPCANFNGVQVGWMGGYSSGSGNTIEGLTQTTASWPTIPGGGANPPLAAQPATITGTSALRDQVALNGATTGFMISYGGQLPLISLLPLSSSLYTGVEASYTFSNAQGKTQALKIKIKDSFKLGARLGGVIGKSLVYAGGGWTNTKVQGIWFFPYESPAYPFLDNRLNGWYLTVGGDTKITSNLILGVVYQYSHLPSYGKGPTTAPAGDFPPTPPQGWGNAVVTAPTTTANFKEQVNNSTILIKVGFAL